MEFLENNIEEWTTPYLEDFYRLIEVTPNKFVIKGIQIEEYLEFLKEEETPVLYDRYKLRETPTESYKIEDCFNMVVDYDVVSKGRLYDAFKVDPPKLNRDKVQIEYLQK